MSEKPAEKTVAAIAPTVTPPAPPMPVVAVVKPPLSYTQKVMIAVGIAMAALLLSMLVYQISQILVLMFAGLLLAVFVSAPADLLAKYARLERTYALGLVLLGLLIVVAGGGYFVGFTITRQVEELTRTLPGALKQAEADLEHRFAAAEPAATTTAPATELGTASAPATEAAPHSWLADKLIEVRQAATDFLLSETFAKRAGGVVSSTFGIIGNVVIVVGVGLFFALNPKLYAKGLIKLAPMSRRARTAEILSTVRTQLQWWFVGQLCSMVSISLLTFIGLSILGVPMAFTLAILAGLMTFIPNFGPIIAGLPAVLVAFAPQGDQAMLNPSRAGWVIALYFGIQMLDGWVITPYVQGRTIALPPAMIIISQVVLALLLGPIGLVLATPILAATIVIVRMVYVEDVLGDIEKAAAST